MEIIILNSLEVRGASPRCPRILLIRVEIPQFGISNTWRENDDCIMAVGGGDTSLTEKENNSMILKWRKGENTTQAEFEDIFILNLSYSLHSYCHCLVT